MTTLKEINKAPSLAIIDAVINRIESGQDWYMCVAFSNEVELKLGYYYTYQLEYRLQLSKFVLHKYGKLPKWWGKSRYGYTEGYKSKCKQARLKILRQFRKACIDAAKQ